jgi:hypothetical protein
MFICSCDVLADVQVALVEQLLDEVWSGPFVVVVNPTWLQGTPQQYQRLVESFDPVYSFLPIALQVNTCCF